MIKVGEHITLDIIGTKKEYDASTCTGALLQLSGEPHGSSPPPI